MKLLEVVAWFLFLGSLLQGHRSLFTGEPKQPRRVVLSVITLYVVVGFFSVVGGSSKSTWKAWMQEDAWVEWSTVAAFAAAAVWMFGEAWRAWRHRSDHQGARVLEAAAWTALGFFCAFVAGEEISWGQRLLAFQPPEIFLQVNYQQELNVHNLLKGKKLGGFKLDSRYLVAVLALGFAFVYRPVVVRLGKKALFSRLSTTTPPLWLVPFFAFVAALELTYPIDLAGEAAELLFGLLFMAVVLDARARAAADLRARSGVAPAWRGPAAILAATAAGVVIAPFVQFLVVGSDEEAVAATQAEVEQLAADIQAVRTSFNATAKKRGYGSVHKRIYTASTSGYFDLGGGAFLEGKASPANHLDDAAHGEAPELRRDRKGYFLDPWNNPYWIYYSKKRRFVVIYSFGPNRRRDTNVKKLKKKGRRLREDDIGLRLDWEP